MRTVLVILATALALPPAGFAQDRSSPSNELTFQFGKVFGQGRRFLSDNLPGQILPGQILTEENGIAGGIVYNRRLVGRTLASLHFHLPLFVFENKFGDGNPLGVNIDGLGDTTSVTGFIAPGLQIRFLEPFPIQPYAFAGVGYAHVARLIPREGFDGADFDHEGTWGVSSGGGVDVMLGRHFGIRGEIRSLTTGGKSQVIPAVLLDDPSTRWGATGGLVFRF